VTARLALLLVLVPVLCGCGLGAGAAPGSLGLTVTDEFGAQPLAAQGPLKVAGQETVMSLLERNYSVGTRYAGKFVQSIDGLAGGEQGGQPVDWFYYVNGVEAGEGAAATDVHAGDQIWWDRHDWSQTDDVPAVVGSFPEPFLNGYGGKRYPVRVECASVTGSACRTVVARLRGLGVPAAIAATGGGGGPQTLRVLVGPWRSIGGDSTAAAIERGPRASGVYATFSAKGRVLTLLGPDGRPAASPPGEVGLIAATRQGEDAPVWVITGTGTAGVARAAEALNPLMLRDHFAVAVAAAGEVPLPVLGR
jgi:hypothetical protein